MMSQHPRSHSAWMHAVLLSGPLFLAQGCVDNNISLYIQQMQVPQAQGSACTISADPSAAALSEGVLDLALRDSYSVSPLLHSELIRRGNSTEGIAESNTAVVQGFIIEVHRDSPTGATVAQAFSVNQTLYVPAALGSTPGYGVSTVQIIPPQITDILRGEVCQTVPPTSTCPRISYTSTNVRLIVRVRAFGETVGTVAFQTPFYDFPVSVCCGCLLAYPADAIDPATGLCTSGAAPSTPAACSTGQDFAVDCRLCAGNPLCSRPCP